MFDYLSQNLDTLAKIATVLTFVGGVLIFLVRNRRSVWSGSTKVWGGAWGWLYRHTNRYYFKHLDAYLEAQAHVYALETERRDAEIKALQEQNKALDKKVEETRILMMETWNDLTAYMRAAKAQHESLDNRTSELQALADDLVVLEAKYRRDTTDRSPEAKRIIEAAKGRDIPPLPKLPGT